MELLSPKFLAKYPDFPEHMNELGKFVYYRTYSRYLEQYGRRETWKETVKRATEYNIKLGIKHYERLGHKPPMDFFKKEAELLFDNMFNLRQFLSGRTLWVGMPNEDGVSWKYPLANFNCSFTNIESWEDLCELFYLLLVGTGVGFKCTKEMARKLSPIRNNITLVNVPYTPLPKHQRLERSKMRKAGDIATIFVGDSKEGWVESLRLFFELLTKQEHEDVRTIQICYDSVRPQGERLRTFGGHASGPEPLMEMFQNIVKVLKNELDPYQEPWEVVDPEKGYVRVRPIAILDIGNLIGNNVVVGGVRRTAEIFLFDADDFESMFAKYGINGLYGDEAFERHEYIKNLLIRNMIPVPKWFDQVAEKKWVVYHKDGQTFFDTFDEAKAFATKVKGHMLYPANPGRPLHHRRMSNNSVAFTRKPPREILHLIFSMLRMEGEPGFINLEQAARRRLAARGILNPDQELLEAEMYRIGLNPCAEIILNSKGVCNLTTVNVAAFVQKDEENGGYRLDLSGLMAAQALSARCGLRMTLADLELDAWDKVQKRDRLLGCSLTGWKDALAMLEYDDTAEEFLLSTLATIARQEAEQYAKALRVPTPLLTTTVKPEGTLSQVAGGVSSGLHWSHAPYYIRRIRIAAVDPLAQAVKEMGWTVNPEVGTEGETHEERMQNAKTLVIDFPIASGANRTKDDVSCREQFETYFRFQRHYTDHNASNTIHVRPEEWSEAEEIVWENWDNFTAVSFLAYNGGTYALAPYEKIDRETYERLKAEMKPFDPSILQKYETGEDFDLTDAAGCEGGACPIR